MPREYIYGIGYSQFEEHTNNCPKNGVHEWKKCKNPMSELMGDTYIRGFSDFVRWYVCEHCGAYLEIDSGD